MSAEHNGNAAGPGRRRIAIVGGGFGGLAAARKLKRVNVDVTLADRMNHHLFQPLLYQVAAGDLATGQAASPIRAMLSRQANVRAELQTFVGGPTGVERDRSDRLRVQPDNSLPGHPEISVIGDAAALAGPDGRPRPGLATVAIQQARNVAHGVRNGAPGAIKPFRYVDKGAVVGRRRAVCEIHGLKRSGPPAFATYLGVHLYYLGGVPGRRISVLSAWASSAGGREQSRVIEHELPRERVRV